jgi:NAD(P)-dependent dehydrogenase (short-subunit alcohol dehydrogenase family)
MKNILDNRTAIITGANQGLGLAIASAYVKAGASVLLCARDEAKLEEAQKFLSALRSPNRSVIIQAADVSKPEDVKRIVAAALKHFPQLHILVNNAGVYGPLGKIEDVDWENWRHAVDINLFGSILMCREVLPHFKSHHYGKIIQLSGGGATNPLPRISAYAASKAAVVRFAESLAYEVRSDNIDVNSIAPGPLNTRLLEEVLAAGPEKVGQIFFERSLKQKEQGGAPLKKGADLAVFLASTASDGITGKLISAIWDPWENFREHLEDLQKSDVYTLRRIIPKDRGFNWG